MKIEVIVEMSWMKLVKDFYTFFKYPAMFFCSRPPHGREKEHPKVNINSLSANPTRWPNTLKTFVGKLPTNCLSVFGHFEKLALKGLKLTFLELIPLLLLKS